MSTAQDNPEGEDDAGPQGNQHRLKVLWERYQFYTAKASDTVRNSAIAGLAAAWLFSGTGDGLDRLAAAPGGLLIAGALFAASLGLDVVHYVLASALFRHEANQHELKGKGSDDLVNLPLYVPTTIRVFFYLKVLALIVGYLILALVLASAT